MRTAIGTRPPLGRGGGRLGGKDRYPFVRSFRCPLAHRTHRSGAAAVIWLNGADGTRGIGFQTMSEMLTGGKPVPRCQCEALSTTGFAEFRRIGIRPPGPPGLENGVPDPHAEIAGTGSQPRAVTPAGPRTGSRVRRTTPASPPSSRTSGSQERTYIEPLRRLQVGAAHPGTALVQGRSLAAVRRPA
jgi:hypothetical protein